MTRNENEKMITPFTEYIIKDEDEITSLINEEANPTKIESDEAIFFKIPSKDNENRFYEIKIFKQEYFKNNFRIKLKRFLREVSIMARIKHIGTVDIKLWSVSQFFTEEGKYEPDKDKFQALILTPYYEHLEAKIFKNNLTKVIFIYGCLRAYAYIHSFDYILRNIEEDNILCSKGTGKNKDLYFPKISNFNTSKKQENTNQNSFFGLNTNYTLLTEENFTKKRDVLSFGIFLYRKTESTNQNLRYNPTCKKTNPFKPLIEKIITEESNRIDFRDACIMVEKEIAPSILNKEEMERFQEYVKEINEYEGGYYGYAKIDTLFDKMNLTDDDKANKYQEVRKILKQANHGDPRAAFVISLYYYTGNILPKDLSLCFLYLKISYKCSFNTIVDSFRRSLISIMFRKRKINPDGEEEYDDEALFYQGAFYESPKVVDVEEKLFLSNEVNKSSLNNSMNAGSSKIRYFDPNECEDINKSIKCYMDSLNIKKSPAAYGRIGTLLTKYTQKKLGPCFLKLASDQNDLYGMVNYGRYLAKTGDLDKAEEIFLKLRDQEFIDASFTLGNIYFSKGEFKKSDTYFKEAIYTYGDDNAKKYREYMRKKIKEQKK